ncbi:hypothetical protein J6590_049958 [Homalodisca vitripennis]|nr:hypothetical protein J6590_049958 [Homalodisca vitripennis]
MAVLNKSPPRCPMVVLNKSPPRCPMVVLNKVHAVRSLTRPSPTSHFTGRNVNYYSYRTLRILFPSQPFVFFAALHWCVRFVELNMVC